MLTAKQSKAITVISQKSVVSLLRSVKVFLKQVKAVNVVSLAIIFAVEQCFNVTYITLILSHVDVHMVLVIFQRTMSQFAFLAVM